MSAWQFHEDPRVVARWQALGGRALVWLSDAGRRRRILSALALVIGSAMTLSLLRQHAALPVPRAALGQGLVVALQFLLLWGVYQAALHHARLPAPLRRHPQLALHAVHWSLLAVLMLSAPTAGPWREVLVGLALVLPVLLWRCGYLLMAGQHGRLGGGGPGDHLFYLWPAWGGSDTPYGKGMAYLAQCEARTPEALARSQLAGLRLLALALLWRLVLTAFEGLVYGPGNELTARAGGFTLGVPRLREQLVADVPVPWHMAWAGIYCELFKDVLRLAIKGHLIVGLLRLFGWNVFRNTYKPLLAESVVEFWNRYFYYFKELLSVFFFMPVFTGIGRHLRQWPALRQFAAVFAAACVGNAYYHLIKEADLMAQGQVLELLWSQRSRLFYCLMLAIGIHVSMLREPARRAAGEPAAATRVRRMLAVWSFFALITIWNAGDSAGFMDRVRFAARLFGLA